MNLDINTPRGQETVEQEWRAAAIYQHNRPAYRYCATDKKKPIKVDAVIVRPELHCWQVSCLAETKCRKMSLVQLKGEYGWRWLVTAEKVINAAKIADAFCVPLVGFLYLVPDDLLLVKCLYRDGGWLTPLNVQRTLTQATVNGGMAERDNAYLDMHDATEMRLDLEEVA